jgi:hypothetical protein
MNDMRANVDVRVVEALRLPERGVVLAVVDVLRGQPEISMTLHASSPNDCWSVVDVLPPPPDARERFVPPRLSLALRNVSGIDSLGAGASLSNETGGHDI